MSTSSNLQVYQMPHDGGMFVLHPPLLKGEDPLTAWETVVVHQYGTDWLCLCCYKSFTAPPCDHIRQVQEWLLEKERNR